MSDLDLAAMLNNPDTQTLKNQYYDYLSQALSPENKNPEPSSSSLFIRGLLPTIATGLLTGGKALQYAAEPINNTLKTLEDEAKSRAKFNVENSLAGAKLIGDELQTREKRIQDAFDKSESRKLKEEQLKEQQQYRNDTLDLRRDQIGATQAIAGMAAADRRDRMDDANKQRAVSEEDRVIDDFRKDSSTYGETKRNIKNLQTLSEEALKNPETAQAVQSTLVGMAVQVSQGKARVSDSDIKLYKNDSAYSNITKLANWVNGGAKGAMPEASVQSIRKMADILNEKLHEDYKDRIEKTYLDRADKLRFGDPKNVKDFISTSSPFRGEQTQSDKIDELKELIKTRNAIAGGMKK